MAAESSSTSSLILKWERNGELAHNDLRDLIERLVHVESDHHTQELTRLTSRNPTSN